MRSTTLSLTSLLSIMGSFQGILGLPASSTTGLSPESTIILNEPVQATPTAAVSVATTLNSTASPLNSESGSNDPVVQRSSPVSRDAWSKTAWIGTFDNDKCSGSSISSILYLTDQERHAIDIKAETYLGVFWGSNTWMEVGAFDVWKKRDCHGKSSKKIKIIDNPKIAENPKIGPESCIKYTQAASAVRVTAASYAD